MIREIESGGRKFKIFYLETYPHHASWASYNDENPVREAFWKIKDGDSVLDIGAACGSYALIALAHGAKKVWAWSPQGYPGETEQEIVQKSAELNGWSDKCVVYGSGLYSSSGYLHTVDQTLHQSVPDEFAARTTGNVIPVETLDSWASREMSTADRVDWMKLDVEGAEVEVLKGGENLIKQFKPRILVENHIFRRLSIIDEVFDFLSALGYMEVGRINTTKSVIHALYI